VSDASVPPYTFVSYAAIDRARVLALVEHIRSLGVEVWLDQHDIEAGASWSRRIAAVESGAISLLTIASGEIGWMALDNADLDAAERYAHAGLLMAEQVRSRRWQGIGLMLLARVAHERGDRPVAQRCVVQSLRALQGYGVDSTTLAALMRAAVVAISTHSLQRSWRSSTTRRYTRSSLHHGWMMDN
jgi:hypothetical protein